MGTFRWIGFALALALSLGGGGALSQVYRWTDSSGKVHFGDRPDATTDPLGVTEVVVRPNLVQGLKDAPAASANGATGSPPVSSAGGAGRSQPSPRPGFASQSQESCKAKMEAYKASRACFDECGTFNGNAGGRNNADCDYCVDLPMPNC